MLAMAKWMNTSWKRSWSGSWAVRRMCWSRLPSSRAAWIFRTRIPSLLTERTGSVWRTCTSCAAESGEPQHKAYAYLLLPRDMMTVGTQRAGGLMPSNSIPDSARDFRIAMRDLEIRGAGNILGTAQSGHIINIGFDLYCQLLQQAVEELQGKRPRIRIDVRCGSISSQRMRLSTSVPKGHLEPAFIPADYISQPQMRIQAYKKLAEANSKEALQKLGTRWRDRFGPHPDAVRNLLTLNEIKLIGGPRRRSSCH